MIFELKQYDNVLLKFRLERTNLGEIVYHIDCVNYELKHLLPIGLVPNPEGLAKWLSSRVIPKNREFVDMMIFDDIICNTDRHFGNFGLLVENATNKPISLAPIFDNGLSLFNFALEDDLLEIEKHAQTRSPAFDGVSYDALVKEFLSDRQREELRKLINFTLKKHPKCNLSNARLKTIEAFIQTRVQNKLVAKVWRR